MGGVVILALQTREQRLRGLHCWVPVTATAAGWDLGPICWLQKSPSAQPPSHQSLQFCLCIEVPSEAQTSSYHPPVPLPSVLSHRLSELEYRIILASQWAGLRQPGWAPPGRMLTCCIWCARCPLALFWMPLEQAESRPGSLGTGTEAATSHSCLLPELPPNACQVVKARTCT